MRKGIYLLLFFIFGFNLLGQNPFVDEDYAIFKPPLSERTVGYKINVKLDTINHKIVGNEKIFWLNNTDFPTKTLYFHLFMNAFANNKTMMMKNPEIPIKNKKIFPQQILTILEKGNALLH